MTRLRRTGILAATLLVLPAFSDAQPPDPTGDWPTYNRTLTGERFSPLADINRDNVGSLQKLCSVQVAVSGALHASPLIVDGMLYVASTRTTMAINPVNCNVIWKALYTPSATEVYGTVRGVAVENARLYRGTIDGHLLAMNAKTGELLWNVAPANSSEGEFFSAAPIVDQGKVYIGLSGGDWGIRGRMFAFDAATGHQVWTFNLIPRDGEAGAETWQGDSAIHGGGGTWTSYALDSHTRELFIPVGNPAPDFNADERKGANLYTDALVVLDADTGKLKWWYQVSPNDGNDHDLSAPPMLFAMKDGRSAVALSSKNGYVLVVDRSTHRLIYKTAVTTVNKPSTRTVRDAVKVCPGIVGGLEWNGPAFDIQRRALITGATDWCVMITKETPKYVRGQSYYAGTFSWVTDPPPSGWITSLDSETGVVQWQFHASAPVVSGITPTAGGLVFAGDMSGVLYAFKSSDGSVLYKVDTGGAIAGGISTYSIRGRQYLAVTSGNVSRESWGAVGIPSVVVYGLASDSSATAADQPPADATHGKEIFASTCSLCHGADGHGVSGPSLQNIAAKMSLQEVSDRVQNPRGAMPRLYPGTLILQDIPDVAAYVYTLK